MIDEQRVWGGGCVDVGRCAGDDSEKYRSKVVISGVHVMQTVSLDIQDRHHEQRVRGGECFDVGRCAGMCRGEGVYILYNSINSS